MTAGLPVITPGQMPRHRRDLMRSNRGLIAMMSHDPSRHASALQGLLASAQAIREREDFFELYLVSKDMTEVAVDAARDVPAQILAEHRPCASGLMAFSGGLPATPHPEHPQIIVRPEVLTWTQDAHQAYLILWARPSVNPDLGALPVPAEMTWLRTLSCEIPLHESFQWEDYRPQTVNMVSLALATWMLMDIPTVAQARVSAEAGPRGKGGKRDLPREVKTVDLRRLVRAPSPEEGGAEAETRTYRHQWVVRGHWRNQAVGPEHRDRRTTWVPSYLKGPEGAPFLPSETVFVWRR